MRERIRAIATSKRTPLIVTVTGLVVAGLFSFAAFRLGAAADECAEELVVAIQGKDRAQVDRVLKNPSLRDQLMSAPSVELGYVRPLSSEWTRVGLFVSTGTVTKQVALQLETANGCLFLRDF